MYWLHLLVCRAEGVSRESYKKGNKVIKWMIVVTIVAVSVPTKGNSQTEKFSFHSTIYLKQTDLWVCVRCVCTMTWHRQSFGDREGLGRWMDERCRTGQAGVQCVCDPQQSHLKAAEKLKVTEQDMKDTKISGKKTANLGHACKLKGMSSVQSHISWQDTSESNNRTSFVDFHLHWQYNHCPGKKYGCILKLLKIIK